MQNPYAPELLDQSPAATVALVHDADNAGWTRKLYRPGRGLRMWCPCEKQHCFWINIQDDDPEYADWTRTVMMRKTCWTEEGGTD